MKEFLRPASSIAVNHPQERGFHRAVGAQAGAVAAIQQWCCCWEGAGDGWRRPWGLTPAPRPSASQSPASQTLPPCPSLL